MHNIKLTPARVRVVWDWRMAGGNLTSQDPTWRAEGTHGEGRIQR
jgi:hypothetical protein